VGELGGDTWSGARAGVASGGTTRRPAAALSRSRGGGHRKKKGGRQGLLWDFKISRDLTVKLDFLTILYFK
jgi:hypothetical protein